MKTKIKDILYEFAIVAVACLLVFSWLLINTTLGFILFLIGILGFCLLLLVWGREFLKRKKQPPRIFLIVGILICAASINAQESLSIFLDDGTEIYPESYDIKDQEIHVTLITVVGEREGDSRLLVGVFEGFFYEEPIVPLFEEIISFEGLEEKFGGFKGRGRFRLKIRENLNLYMLVKDKNFIIFGEFLDEKGVYEGYFRICYPLKNLLLNRMNFNGEPIPSKVHSENCEIIKIKIKENILSYEK